MSAHGISPVWIARGNGIPVSLPIGFKALQVICELTGIGDVEPEITLALVCSLEGEQPDVFINSSVSCSTTFLGDVNPVVGMTSIICVVTVGAP